MTLVLCGGMCATHNPNQTFVMAGRDAQNLTTMLAEQNQTIIALAHRSDERAAIFEQRNQVLDQRIDRMQNRIDGLETANSELRAADRQIRQENARLLPRIDRLDQETQRIPELERMNASSQQQVGQLHR